jgi:hypothetical protein
LALPIASTISAASPVATYISIRYRNVRLFSDELPIVDIPGIMMRLGTRHLNF